MAGYTRQSIASIINGEDITAPPLTAEFNQLASSCRRMISIALT